jgi:peptide/nickel transport system substrate-binding protein
MSFSLRKKLLHFFVVGIMLAALLSACGASPTSTPVPATATTAPRPTTAAPVATTAVPVATTAVSSATSPAATTAAVATTAPAPANDLFETPKWDTAGKKGGTFVYSFAGQFPSNLQPYYVSQVVASTVWHQVYSTLINQSDNAKYYAYMLTEIPSLENSGVKLNSDGKSMDVTLKLKPGLKWSDGSALTSKDLAFTHKWIIDKENASLTRETDSWKLITAVETPNDSTAVLKFSQVYGPYLNFLANFQPLPEKIWSKIPLKDAAKSNEATVPTVTSGPMKVEEFTAGDRIVLARNDNFSPVFGFNAYLDKVIYRNTTNSNAGIAAVTKGDLDHVENIDDNQLDAASKVPNSKSGSVQQLSYEFLQFNLTNPILADKNVRMALDMAIDKPALIKQFRAPTAEQLAVTLSPLSAFYNKSLTPTKFDVEAAKKVLEDGGWKAGADGVRVKDGKRLAFSLASTNAAVRVATAEVLIAYWKAIGAEVKFVAYATELFAPWANDGILARGRFDVGMFGQVTNIDPDGGYVNYHSSQIPTDANNGNGNNYGRITDPQIDKLLDDQRATVNLNARKEAWASWAKIMYDNRYVSTLFTRTSNYVTVNKIKNFRSNPTTATNFWNIHEVYIQ